MHSELKDLQVRSASLRNPLKDLEKQAIVTGQAFRQDLGGALGIVSPRLAAVAGAAGPLSAALLGIGAVIAGGLGIVHLTQRATELGSKIFDASQKINFSAETLSGLKVAVELSGGSFEGLTTALGLFDKNLEEAHDKTSEQARIFKALKIDINDNEKALRQAFTALASMDKGAQQTALSMKLFGRSGKDVLGIIKETGGNVDEFIAKMEALGLVISSDAAKRADEFGDKLTMLQAKFDAIIRVIGSELIPVVEQAADDAMRWLQANQGELQKTARELATLVEWIYKLGKVVADHSGLVIAVRVVRQFSDSEGINPFRLTQRGGFSAADIAKFKEEGEFAVAGGAGQASVGAGPPRTPGARISIPGPGGGGGGGKSKQEVALERLRSTLMSLNAEWRKWDVALLDSANASAEAAQKQALLDNVMSSLSSKTRLAISAIRDIDEALERAVSSLPKKSQEAARALIAESLAQFRSNEQRRIAGELNEKTETLMQSWRLEMDNSRSGADEFTRAIQDLERAYARYGLTLDAGTKSEMENTAAMARAAQKARELERMRELGERARRVHNSVVKDVVDLGGGSFWMEGGTGSDRERLGTVEETVLREREQMRLDRMREIAEDLGSVFADTFDSIGHGWNDLWQNMAQTARNISRRLAEELFTGVFSRAFNVPFESRSGGIIGAITNGIINRRPLEGIGSSGAAGGGIASVLAGARALGGPVEANKLYQVNERGMELFRSNQSGQIIPLGQQDQQLSREMRIGIFDNRDHLNEWRPDRVLRASKQTRKIGKLIPGF